jgi:parallel beta-helix repeat protein
LKTFTKLAIRWILIWALILSCSVFSYPHKAQGARGPDPAQSTPVFIPLVTNVCNHCYFVDSLSGSDTNSGTSVDRPWKTLAPVNAASFQPGSTIHFKRGSFWDDQLFIDTSGVEGRPVTFTVYGSGAPPIFSNSGHGLSWTSVIFIQADWIVVDGLIVRDTHDVGIYVAQGSDHNVVRNNEVTDVGEGISVHGQYNLITQNSIHDLHIINDTPGGDDDYGAVGIVLNDSNNEISYNRILHCLAHSYDFGTDGGAIEWYEHANNNYVHHNVASGNAGFLEVGVGSVDGARVAYNVSINNGRFSLINLTGKFASDVLNFRVENNTIIEEAMGGRGWVIFSFEGNPVANTFLIRNNILYARNFQAISNKSSFSHDHNLYSLDDITVLGFTLGPGELSADPQFVNPANLDLHLMSSSPAIDGGIELGYSLDFDNRPVPVQIKPDLGAFEYQGTR